MRSERRLTHGARGFNRACVLAFIVASVACGGTGVFRQYEYEEEIYLSLDGTATVYINSSIPALNALRGTAFDVNPTARVDREAVRAYYSAPATHVTWVRPSRRSNRRFAHIRLEVDDVRRLGEAAPFAWSTYDFGKGDALFIYKQTVGAAAGKDAGKVGWTGREMIAFRLHLPSKIRWNNSGHPIGRGNILAWEQPLTDRLRSVPLDIEARMDPESILYRTLWLFGATFLAVALGFGVVIWRVMRHGAPQQPVGQV
jgi:hypothetical protein